MSHRKLKINCYTIDALHYLNIALVPMGMGIYHTAVVIEEEGLEVSFGWSPDKDVSGVFVVLSRSAPGCTFQDELVIGTPKYTPSRIREIIREMEDEYPASTYHTLTRNCNNFTNDLCERVCGHGIPAYLNRLSNFLAMFAVLGGGLWDSLRGLTPQQTAIRVGGDLGAGRQPQDAAAALHLADDQTGSSKSED